MNTYERRRGPDRRRLSGAQRVAALMIVLGKDAARKVFQRLSEGEVIEIARAAATLGIVDRYALERMIDDFASDFAEGPEVVGTASEAQQLVSETLGPQQVERLMSEHEPGAGIDVWAELARQSNDRIVSMLAREPGWIVAAIVSRLPPDRSSEILAELEDDVRKTSVACMLSSVQPAPRALEFLEAAIAAEMSRSDVGAKEEGPRRVADIVNRMNGDTVDSVMSFLASVSPVEAAIMKSFVFKFEEIVNLSQADRAKVFDTLPTEKVILALKGASPEIVEATLGALGARARRMVESELAGNARAPEREIGAARRAVVDAVLRLFESGAIERSKSTP